MKSSRHLSLKLLRLLVQEGLNIFTLEQAQNKARLLGIKPARVKDIVHALKQDLWIRSLKRGLYAITSESGFAPVPHEYAIATALVTPSAISHWSALHYHHMTQQIPSTIFVLTSTGTKIPTRLPDQNIQFVRIKPDQFFGIERVWLGESRINITDPERTLLDGLMKPHYCGDIQEILHAFKMRGKDLDVDKIIEYACRLDTVIAKRLGFILDTLGYSQQTLYRLLELPMQGIRQLDPGGPAQGPINRQWKIQHNIGGAHANSA